MLKNTLTLFSIQQVRSNTITRKLIDLAECPLIRQKEVLVEVSNKKPSDLMKDVPITHGYRKFFTNKLIEYDERSLIFGYVAFSIRNQQFR